MKKEKFKNVVIYGGSVFLGVMFFVYVISCSWIGVGVREKCVMAKEVYGGGCVEALVSFVDDEGNSLEDRNGAVWALGQLGDERALVVLNKYYTGGECDHDKYLCQHELKKAIKLCKGGFNVSALVWRNGIL